MGHEIPAQVGERDSIIGFVCSVLSSTGRWESNIETNTSGIDVAVVDATGTPVPKARVIITNEAGEDIANGITDPRGGFSVSHTPPGTYKLTLRADGFRDWTESLLVQKHSIAEAKVILSPGHRPQPGASQSGHEIFGRYDSDQAGPLGLDLLVTDPIGAVIPQARITFVQDATGAKFEGHTDERGAFHASGLVEGAYSIEVEMRGFKTHKTSVVVRENEALRMTIQMQVERLTIRDGVPTLDPEPESSKSPSEFLPEPSGNPSAKTARKGSPENDPGAPKN